MRPSRAHRRDGVLLVCVLVCLMVASAIVASTTHSALRSRRNVRLQHQLRQTEFLLDAGVMRAMRRIQQSDNYQGETWQPNGSIGRFGRGRVEIRVASPEEDARSREVEVVARLDASGSQQISSESVTQRTHRFSFQLVEPPNNSESQSAE